MRPRIVRIAGLAAVVAVLSAGLSFTQTANPARAIRDDLGRSFSLPAATPARIVSMAPNITEILYALGLGPNIAGVTRFCDYPPEAAAVEKIGGLVNPNIERVLARSPDLVVAFRGNPLRVVNRLAALDLPVFVLDIGDGLDALYPLISRLGFVTRREAAAAELVSSLRARQRAVEEALGAVRTRPRVFVILHGQGLWTCGGQSYLNDVVARAGGVNIAAPMPKKWVLYSPERIVRDDPDAIFVLARTEADFVKARGWLGGEARLGAVKAVAAGRVHFVDENSASRFGPRLVDVLERMARALHPESFGETKP